MKPVYYVEKLKEVLEERQLNNSKYSLRAFARDMDLHCSTMSQILRGKRNLPLKRANDVADRLGLSDDDKKRFMESFYHIKGDLALNGQGKSYFTSLAFDMDFSKISQAQVIIKEFQSKMTELMKGDEVNETYKLVVQLYPIEKKSSVDEPLGVKIDLPNLL